MFRKRRPHVGARPGTLVISPESPPPRINVMEYDAEGVDERTAVTVDELRSMPREGRNVWIDVQGLGDEQIIRAIGELFHLHPLTLEDIVNVPQRPKAVDYDEYLLVIGRMIFVQDHHTQREQISVVVGNHFVLTFQEQYGDVFDPIRNRLRQGKGPMRRLGPDYLAYAIIDAMIDGYYPVIETFGDRLETLEDRIVETPELGVVREVHEIKRELLAIRRNVWPLREAVNSLVRGESPFITDQVRLYLRDCYDHCVQILDVVETYRELTSGLLDVYLSSVSNRQNEVMKVLTVMASVFIPLTFLAGIYGMNFEYMPELRYRWAYPILWGVMVVLAGVMLWLFRRKGWLGRTRDDQA